MSGLNSWRKNLRQQAVQSYTNLDSLALEQITEQKARSHWFEHRGEINYITYNPRRQSDTLNRIRAFIERCDEVDYPFA